MAERHAHPGLEALKAEAELRRLERVAGEVGLEDIAHAELLRAVLDVGLEVLVRVGSHATKYSRVGAGCSPSQCPPLELETWGSLPTLFTGAVFTLGLILVVIASSEPLTGNMALIPLAAFRGRTTLRRLAENFGPVLIGEGRFARERETTIVRP